MGDTGFDDFIQALGSRGLASRRAVLRAAGVMLGAGVAGTAVRPWAAAGASTWVDLAGESRGAGQVRDFSLAVSRLQWELAPGDAVEAYAYNGQVPGPELRVNEGDTVRVRVTNGLDEATTIHWHGVDVPVGMDGVPGLSQEPIPPGGTFTYEFVATPPGTRWYHSHFNELHQLRGGLVGALIIEPRESASRPDREYVVVTGEWLPGDGMGDPPDAHGSDATGMSGAGHPSRFTVNGKSYPHASPLVVREGERVRLRLINAGATVTQVLALAGHGLLLTHTDGNPLRVPVPTEAVSLGVGERADVEFVASSPGRWQLGARSSEGDRGLGVDVVYEGHEADPVQFPPPADLDVAGYEAMIGPLPPERAQRTFSLVLSGDTSGAWTINDRRYPDTEPITVGRGERVILELFNMSMADHPMHLHGHTFQVVAVGGAPVAGPMKDTLNLRHMEEYSIEFLADNPGRWLFHCHNLEHMMAGMMTEVHYQ